jgi:hypothetical protein
MGAVNRHIFVLAQVGTLVPPSLFFKADEQTPTPSSTAADDEEG